MRTFYISGKITGSNNYMEEFASAQRLLEKAGYRVLNPAAACAALPSDLDYEIYMKVALAMLEMADAICMLNSWEDSKGANREYGYALGAKMDIYFIDDFK